MKRLVDIIGSLVGMLIFLIPGLLIGAAIKIEDNGPIFYGQLRVGKDGKLFKIWKFRSMVPDAHSKKTLLLEKNVMDGPTFKMKNDPRITKVGNFIRKRSLDEIPQFINVFLGEMSLVGPRPALPEEAKEYDERTSTRLKAMPGITGLWQVSGRNDLSYSEMINLDLEYISNYSIFLDFKILFLTVIQMFDYQNNGAY